MAELVVFDDNGGAFGPLTQMRPVFSLRTGGMTTLERIERTLGRFAARFLVPNRLQSSWEARVSTPVNRPPSESALCVNGRWTAMGELPELENGQAAMIGDEVLAARMCPDDLSSFFQTCQLPDGMEVHTVDGESLYTRPWDILTLLPEVLQSDLSSTAIREDRVDPAVLIGEHPVHVDESATVFPGVVFDTTAGAIVIEADAVVRPHTVVCGPCWIGRGSVIVAGAVIRANTVMGPGCKVGGEVGASILQGWTNKAHDGYLGDSILGSWVNLGAGTTTSNLLNTYGEISVRLTPEASRERTGRNFVGSIIGDHVKTAIGTRLMTGTSIGTGSMIATSSYAPSTLGPLRWVTDAGEKPYRIDRFLDMAKAMMSRRDRELDVADEQCLRELAAST